MINTILLDGRKIAAQIEGKIAKEVAGVKGRAPSLAVVLVGDYPPSKVYVGRKVAACERVGIISKQFFLNESASREELHKLIHTLNKDKTIDGILIQLPLPSHLSALEVMSWIDPDKDVDGLHPLNQGKLLEGYIDGFIPCTPFGIKRLMDAYHLSVSGKHVVILGRSNIVGKPMAALLAQTTPGFDATVTILHRDYQPLSAVTLAADILIVAAGQPHVIKKEMVKKGASVIDVGITKRVSGEIVGDVDFEHLMGHASHLTPVPGGVGPMTIALLIENTWKSFSQSHS